MTEVKLRRQRYSSGDKDIAQDDRETGKIANINKQIYD